MLALTLVLTLTLALIVAVNERERERDRDRSEPKGKDKQLFFEILLGSSSRRPCLFILVCINVVHDGGGKVLKHFIAHGI